MTRALHGVSMDLDFALRHSFGVARTQLLLRCGLTKPDIRKRVANGTLTQPRRGWYATATANRDALAAVRAGGILTCVSALDLHDVWTPPNRAVHLRQTDHALRQDARDTVSGGFVRCGDHLRHHRPATAVDPSLLALSAAARCVSEEYLVAIMDSLLRTGRVDRDGIRSALADHPARIGRLLDSIDPRAESGTESLVRLRLARRQVRGRLQVQIGDIGRVDLLIGRRLVIEVDGYEYHADPDTFEKDRRRDRRLIAAGYLVVRLTYRQVMYEWEEAEADILALIRRREHRKRVVSLANCGS